MAPRDGEAGKGERDIGEHDAGKGDGRRPGGADGGSQDREEEGERGAQGNAARVCSLGKGKPRKIEFQADAERAATQARRRRKAGPDTDRQSSGPGHRARERSGKQAIGTSKARPALGGEEQHQPHGDAGGRLPFAGEGRHERRDREDRVVEEQRLRRHAEQGDAATTRRGQQGISRSMLSRRHSLHPLASPYFASEAECSILTMSDLLFCESST